MQKVDNTPRRKTRRESWDKNTSDFESKLEFLSDSSIYFLKAASYKEIFPYVAEKLHLLNDAIIVVNEFDASIDSTIVRAIEMGKAEQSKAQKILGKKLIGLTLKFHEATRKKFISGKLTKVHGGLRELSFYRIPNRICILLEKVLNIGEIYGIAFVVEKDLLGTVSIAAQRGNKLKDKHIVEAFINQAAVALKNKKTEKQVDKLMERLKEEKKHLIELERKKDEFIGIASHELKTPLTSTKVYAELLKKDLLKEIDGKKKKTHSYISKLLRELAKIEKLVNDMLDVSKIEKGKLVFDMKMFDLERSIADTIADYQLTTKSYKIVKKGKLTRKVFGDEVRVQQVITNLLNNAVKYSPRADKIVVELSENKDEARICIRDYGLGIPKKLREKIFEQYYRIDGKDRQGGFGLGLYIASEIVKRHGGRIWVKSSTAKGSTFCITLPTVKK